MRKTSIIVAAWAAAILLGSAEARERAQIPAAPPASAVSPFLAINGETRPPMGWIQFCRGQPDECQRETAPPRDATLTRAKWQELDLVNRQTNRDIEPMTDWDHYAMADYWTYPVDGKGDCEKYALEKRRRLRERGWPESALLITVVLDQHNEGHAILMVRTSDGDFILDNMVDELLPWHQTGYRYIKRQSQWNPNIWVSLPADAGRAPLAVSVR